MSSYYLFNISRQGTFYARIKDEHMMQDAALRMLRDLRTRFPESEGFKIDLTRWECTSQQVAELKGAICNCGGNYNGFKDSHHFECPLSMSKGGR